MSTPPVLANWTGTCKQYEPQCIGHTQKVLFYTGMSLLAIGISGYNVSLTPFLKEQDENYSPDADVDNNRDSDSYDSDDNEDEGLDYVDYFQVVLIPVIAAIALPYIKSWSLAFGIPAISSAIATSVFLTGSFKYRKAERIRRWELLSGTQIGTTEFAVRTVPMWMTFIVCGIVTSTGNTYFIEQANRMDRKLGSWNVPIELLLLLSGYSREGVAFVAEKYPKKLESSKSIPIIIADAMIFSVLCCITAAKVETRRINVITRYGLLDKPNEEIPMKVGWLYPQFFLLSFMDAGIEVAVASLTKKFECPGSVRKYIVCFAKGVCGVGFMCGVMSVYAVGEVSEIGGKTNWFQFTLNRSRLDRYYWVLASLTSLTLVLFVQVAWCYKCIYKQGMIDPASNDE
ncbi:hypothetical protein ABFX02_10G019900 [Erythranthe guttata]